MPVRTFAACLTMLACGAPLGAVDVPNPMAVRQQIDQVVAARTAAHKPANLGMLRDVVGLTLNYGGSAFEAGNFKGCEKFYLDTATNLGASFPSAKDATPKAQQGMRDLADAIARATTMDDPTRATWTLRFAFDQIVLACGVSQGVAQAQVQFGEQYFSRGDLDEAAIAFGRAEQEVNELIGVDGGGDLGSIQGNARMAGIAHAQVLLAQGKVKDAATLMATSVLLLPELPNSNFDWRKIAGDPDPNKSMAIAGDAAHAHPDDLDCGLLLGMEQKFNGHADDASQTLAALDKAHPGNAAVKMLQEQKASVAVPPAAKPANAGGTGEFVP